jgi:hypothetical protein
VCVQEQEEEVRGVKKDYFYTSKASEVSTCLRVCLLLALASASAFFYYTGSGGMRCRGRAEEYHELSHVYRRRQQAFYGGYCGCLRVCVAACRELPPVPQCSKYPDAALSY